MELLKEYCYAASAVGGIVILWSQKIQQWILGLSSFLWRTRRIWLRAGICGFIGAIALIFDESTNYDLRLASRGAQSISDQILLINVPEEKLARYSGNRLSLMKSYLDLSIEPNYWDQSYWQSLLQQLLAAEPESIMITFFVDQKLRPRQPIHPIFYHEKVHWMARSDDEGRIHRPLFASRRRVNYGIGNLIYDHDRVVRRFSLSPVDDVLHLTQATSSHRVTKSSANSLTGEMKMINFRGPQGSFPALSADQISTSRGWQEKIRGKTVIIGSMRGDNQLLQTPLGLMSRAEVFANIAENIRQGHWIQRLPSEWILLYMLGILTLATSIMIRYPQTLALIFLVWIGIGAMALSIWAFDSLNLWVPAFSVAVQLFSIFVLFVSFQLALQEKAHWKITQEARTHHELEQLKNNFVSLFSHDLKTPIAKIQAITDRLISQGNFGAHEIDLLSLRKSSTELHSYIQKILQVSRVEAKKFKLKKDVADLNEVVEAVISRMAPLAREKKIRIQFSAEPLFTIDMDTTLIHEVVLNLIDNAIKYSRENSMIEVTTTENDEGVEFSISDHGQGISSDEQRKIWSKFYRASQNDANTQGSGLGLYLSKYFIELHGGEISLESEIGHGTRVRFLLPFEMNEKSDDQSYDLAAPLFENADEGDELRWQ